LADATADAGLLQEKNIVPSLKLCCGGQVSETNCQQPMKFIVHKKYITLYIWALFFYSGYNIIHMESAKCFLFVQMKLKN